MNVRAVALEDLMGLDFDLNINVAGAGGAFFPLSAQAQCLPVFKARGDDDIQCASVRHGDAFFDASRRI